MSKRPGPSRSRPKGGRKDSCYPSNSRAFHGDIYASRVYHTDRESKTKVVPHSLRHAFASHAMDGGADILVLKAILGHASLRSTEIYLHPSKETLRKAINDHLASDMLRDMRTRRLGILRIQAHRGTTEKMTA